MTTYIIDTAAIKRLVSTGMPVGQAEAVVEVFTEAPDGLATKSDIDGLKNWITSRILMCQEGTVAVLYSLIRLCGVG